MFKTKNQWQCHTEWKTKKNPRIFKIKIGVIITLAIIRTVIFSKEKAVSVHSEKPLWHEELVIQYFASGLCRHLYVWQFWSTHGKLSYAAGFRYSHHLVVLSFAANLVIKNKLQSVVECLIGRPSWEFLCNQLTWTCVCSFQSKSYNGSNTTSSSALS